MNELWKDYELYQIMIWRLKRFWGGYAEQSEIKSAVAQMLISKDKDVNKDNNMGEME